MDSYGGLIVVKLYGTLVRRVMNRFILEFYFSNTFIHEQLVFNACVVYNKRKHMGEIMKSDFLRQILLLLFERVLDPVFKIVSSKRVENIEKGNFKIGYRNVCCNYFKKSEGPYHHFDLTKCVLFKNVEKETVTVLQKYVFVNENKTVCKENVNMQFEKGEVYSVDFRLNDIDKQAERLKIVLILLLENSRRKKYVQKTDLSFCKSEYENIWILYDWKTDFFSSRKLRSILQRRSD